MYKSFDHAVQSCQDEIINSVLATFAKLSPLPAEELGSLLRSTLPRHMSDSLSAALRVAGWLSVKRNGEPVADLDKWHPHNGDIITLNNTNPTALRLRNACQPK